LKLISELGLRYRPAAQVDIDDHRAQLALLASDLADLPPDALRAAIDQWVMSKPFMPKASELADLARAASIAFGPRLYGQAKVDADNARLEAEGNRRIRWQWDGFRAEPVDWLEWMERERPAELWELARREEAARLRAGAPG
jgi:hypothetical protein